MNDRANLVERAAALLRDANSLPTAKPDVSIPTFAPTWSLSRSLVLDRDHLAQTGIIMPWTTASRVVEEFRIIKRNLMFPWQLPEYPKAANRSPRVIMVTSSRPREGKTFCSVNLALAFAAEENLVTVLIDGDAMRGDAARVLKTPSEPGFIDVLTGERRLQEVLIQTDLSNLLVLPPGTHAPHVPELLSGRGPGVLFGEIAQRYPEHVIVLDTPPCLASTDAAALAPIASQIVFVVEAERTQHSEIESSLNLLSGGPQINFLLNKSPTASEHFGHYSYYYKTGTTEAKARVD